MARAHRYEMISHIDQLLALLQIATEVLTADLNERVFSLLDQQNPDPTEKEIEFMRTQGFTFSKADGWEHSNLAARLNWAPHLYYHWLIDDPAPSPETLYSPGPPI